MRIRRPQAPPAPMVHTYAREATQVLELRMVSIMGKFRCYTCQCVCSTRVDYSDGGSSEPVCVVCFDEIRGHQKLWRVEAPPSVRRLMGNLPATLEANGTRAILRIGKNGGVDYWYGGTRSPNECETKYMGATDALHVRRVG